MIFLYIVAGLVALFIILAVIGPKSYNVSRSIAIDRSKSDVFSYIKYVKNQDEWSPWKKRDPNMKQEFSGVDGTVGFISKWDSDAKNVGSGEQEIMKIVENDRVETHLRFLKPWKSESNAYISVADTEGGKTEVTWGFSGKNKVPMNIFMLFMNMDKAVGKDFDEGLAELKRILEQ